MTDDQERQTDSYCVTKRGIAYTVTAGIEPTIVFLHGLAGYGDEWKPLVERLKVDNRIILVDLRGHGASSRSAGQDIVGEVMADVVDVIETLAIEQCVLVGQSLGGLVALDVARRLPRLVPRLVLVEAGTRPITPKSLSSVQKWLADFPSTFRSVGEAESFFGGSPLRQKTWAHGLAQDNDGYHPRFDRTYASHLIQALGRKDGREDWKAANAAALLIVATRGGVPDDEVAEMVQAKPSTAVARIAGGHDIHLDQPAAVAAEIVSFVNR